MANRVSRNYFPLRAWAFPDYSRARPTSAPFRARQASHRRSRHPRHPCRWLRVAATDRRDGSDSPAAHREAARRPGDAGGGACPRAVHPRSRFDAWHRHPRPDGPGARIARQRHRGRAHGARDSAVMGHGRSPRAIGPPESGVHIGSPRALGRVASAWRSTHESAARRAAGIPDALAGCADGSALRADSGRTSLRGHPARLSQRRLDPGHPSHCGGRCAARRSPVDRRRHGERGAAANARGDRRQPRAAPRRPHRSPMTSHPAA